MTRAINKLSETLLALPDSLGDETWEECREVLYDQLHHAVDRRAPYFLNGNRRGAPRIAWESKRTMENLLERLRALRDARKGGNAFVRGLVEHLLEEIETVTEHYRSGSELWNRDQTLAA